MRIPHLSSTVLLGHLQTPLAGATVFGLADSATDAFVRLSDENFDQAPVVQGEQAVGFVLTADLEGVAGRVDAAMRPIYPRALASETTPLGEALQRLAEERILFLLSGTSVSGFVVPADLNKQAGRGHFYLAISELELRLAAYVRSITTDGTLLEKLPGDRRRAVRRAYRKRVEGNVEAGVVSELNLSDLLWVAGQDPTFLASAEIAPDLWPAAAQSINSLRIRVAHPVILMVDTSDEIDGLLESAELVRRATDALETLSRAQPGRGDP